MLHFLWPHVVEACDHVADASVCLLCVSHFASLIRCVEEALTATHSMRSSCSTRAEKLKGIWVGRAHVQT